MKQKLTLLLIVIAMAGCQMKEAYNYNQKIVKMEEQLMPAIEETENRIKEYYEAGDFEGIARVAAAMEQKVDAQLQGIKAMEAPSIEEAENFKKATIKYFSYIKSIYTHYKKWGRQQSDEDRQREWEDFVQVTNRKDEVTTTYQNAQLKFAEANGMKIEDAGKKISGEDAPKEAAPKEEL